MRSAVASRSIFAAHAMTAAITLGVRTCQVEAVCDAHDLDAARAQFLERDEHIRNARAREPVEPEHVETLAAQSPGARIDNQAP